jgi:hypothetical protein
MKNKVQIQKGPVVAEQKTMKTMTRAEINREDYENCKKIIDGQTLKLHTPK